MTARQTRQESAGSVARRTLHFGTIDDALVEVDRLVAAAQQNRLAYAGKWQLPTMLNHLAVWAEFAYSPAPVKIPFFLPWLIRPFRSRILKGQMAAGRRLPKVSGGTLGIDQSIPLDKALRRLQIALLRLKNEAPSLPHPIFGKMNQAQWIALNLRHAELHLSFAVPANAQPA